MYRIVCESYKNYIADFLPDNINDYRYKIMQSFRLILDLSAYMNENKKKSLDYRKLEDLIYLIKQNIEKYPNFKSFLWSLESRDILGEHYGVLSTEEFCEQVRIINMFLRLSYWF